jgi:hypothetical protein
MAATPIAETRFIGRGLAAGAAGGLAAFVVARIFAEPQIQKAIDYESGRDDAQHALDAAKGIVAGAHEHELFTRGVQGGVGIGVGIILFGLALGGIFSVVYVLSSRRWPAVAPRTMAALVALACFAALYFIPALKYPANPPAIGHEETIGARSALYVGMVIISIVSLVAAVIAAGQLSARFGAWNGTIIAGLGLAVVVGIAMLILPTIGHLGANVEAYGFHATETPLPLRAPDGTIVYPGFPADVLAKFRLYSVLGAFVQWATVGIVFGVLAERLVKSAVTADRREPAPRGGELATS